jgi:hypothetical protein
MTYADEEFILADGQEETPEYPKPSELRLLQELAV